MILSSLHKEGFGGFSQLENTYNLYFNDTLETRNSRRDRMSQRFADLLRNLRSQPVVTSKSTSTSP